LQLATHLDVVVKVAREGTGQASFLALYIRTYSYELYQPPRRTKSCSIEMHGTCSKLTLCYI